ncbi:DUF4276 family protein [Nitrospira tepida]|nr:DUF4276 family protein [Nitrospira tepida]
MSRSLGLIAEDHSDVKVIRALIPRITGGRHCKVKPFVGHGCGKIRGKCRQWAINLRSRGCTSLVVVHDLDNKSATDLENELREALNPSPISRHAIVVPVQMIESWLLSDAIAIQKVFNLPSPPNSIPNPEALFDPKSKLEELVYISSGKRKRYINTIHNELIAAEANLERLRKCASFLPLEEFIRTIFHSARD